jgi:hypothetical protein
MFSIGITPGRRGIPETSISSTYESSFSSAPIMTLADRWSLIGTRIEDFRQRPIVKKEVVEKVVHRPSPDPKIYPLIGTYNRVIISVLQKLPANLRKARRMLQVTLTPPTANTTKFFPWTSEEIKDLYEVFQQQIQFRFQMKRLVLHYLQHKSKVMNETDPITMEPPTQVVSLYAPNIKSIYQFEAKSLAHHWTTLLLEHDDFFVEPRFPTNPYTNLPVDCLNLKNTIASLRRHGYLNWILESFASCKFNPTKWEVQFEHPLKIEAIRSTLRDKDSRDRLEYLVEFADKQFYENMVSFNKHLFTWMFKEHPMSHYERSWETLCVQYYINRITTTNSEMLERLQEAIVVKSKRLMDIPPEIKEAWDKVRPRIRLTRSRALSVIDVSSPSIIYTAAVRRGRDALIEDFLLESVLASALESTATSLLTAAAEVETDTEEETDTSS